MNRIIIVFVSLALFAASCSKSPTNVGSNPTLKWTYSGGNFDGTNIVISKPDTIPNTHTFWPYYEFEGTASSSTLHVRLTDIAQGVYTDQNNTIFFGSSTLDAFSLTISTRSGRTIAGTFSGTYQGQAVTGSFANITFPN